MDHSINDKKELLCNRLHTDNRSSLKTEEMDEWLTTQEAAAYLKLSVGSFRNMVSDGNVPHYKLGRRNRYLRGELKKLLMGMARGRLCNDKIR